MGVARGHADEASAACRRRRFTGVVLAPTPDTAVELDATAEPAAQVELGVRPGRRVPLPGGVVTPAEQDAVDPQRATGERGTVGVVLAADRGVSAGERWRALTLTVVAPARQATTGHDRAGVGLAHAELEVLRG